MSARPILFSAPMVRALLSGGKTQTRRLVTSATSLLDGRPAARPAWSALDWRGAWVDPGPSPAGNAGSYLQVPVPTMDHAVQRVYPRIAPGDTLWVRERFRVTWWDEGYDVGVEYADGVTRHTQVPDDDDPDAWIERQCDRFMRINGAYIADGEDGQEGMLMLPEGTSIPWQPSIHMPRAFARIALDVVSVRPERLHAITEEDAWAEGIVPWIESGDEMTARSRFCDLWDSINGTRAAWRSNPWVYRIEFRVRA